jgi:hypothetical protein
MRWERKMAESDSNQQWSLPGFTAAAGGVSAASKTMQAFIDELSQITQKNFEQTTRIMEELQSVRSMGDLLAVQTKFVQETFEAFNERLHRMSALMADLPTELAQAGKDLADANVKATQDATETMSKSIASIGNKFGEPPR